MRAVGESRSKAVEFAAAAAAASAAASTAGAGRVRMRGVACDHAPETNAAPSPAAATARTRKLYVCSGARPATVSE